MAELFTNLKKLFSSGAIVRNIGGRKLKVVDTDSIQRIALKSDKFNRMYSTLHYGILGQQALYTVQTQRLRLFRDYEVMDTDPIIAAALDIYSEEATMKNEMGDILRIKAGSTKVRSVLENLFYDILNIEFNLPTWIRSMVKYGDFFLHLEIAEEYGIVNVIPLPVYDVTRVEGDDPENPNRVRFVVEGGKGKSEFENFQVAHFRLLVDTNFIPYGKAMIEPVRRIWKQLILMEDAMLIHRIMRAPEKRVFTIDIGNIAPNEVDPYMKSIIDQMKKVPYMDPETGEYNLKYNMQNLTEDFYLPVRGGDSGTGIESLSGLEYNAIEDIEYLRNRLMAGLKIPKAFLGYEEQVGSKATLASEDVRFARTIEKIQKIVSAELFNIALIHLYAQGFRGNDLVDFELSLTSPSIIYEQEKIELWNSKISLARDAIEIHMLSEDWVYEQIFNMTQDEINEQREKIVEDIKRKYRYEQIEQEGNDPFESGQGFGGSSPNEFGENKNYNLTFDEEYEPVKPSEDGRRGKKIRTRKKDEPFGEDPLGQKDMEKTLKLDTELNYDANKKKHLSRKLKKAESILGKGIKRKKILKEDTLTNLELLKNYFNTSGSDNKENKDETD